VGKCVDGCPWRQSSAVLVDVSTMRSCDLLMSSAMLLQGSQLTSAGSLVSGIRQRPATAVLSPEMTPLQSLHLARTPSLRTPLFSTGIGAAPSSAELSKVLESLPTSHPVACATRPEQIAAFRSPVLADTARGVGQASSTRTSELGAPCHNIHECCSGSCMLRVAHMLCSIACDCVQTQSQPVGHRQDQSRCLLLQAERPCGALCCLAQLSARSPSSSSPLVCMTSATSVKS
jgi:hypothetical protein